MSRASPVRFSDKTGLRLCGMAEEPFCPGWKNSSASRTSLRCRCRTSTASRSMPAATTARVAKKAAWRSRGMTWVDTGSGRRPRRSATKASTRGSTAAKVPTAPEMAQGGNLLPRCQQAGAVAGEFRVMPSELEAEGGGFGMDAVAAADGGGVFVLERPRPQRRAQTLHPGQEQIGRARQLHRQAGVEHVRNSSAPGAGSAPPARSPRQAR